jgi:hypothetical protein
VQAMDDLIVDWVEETRPDDKIVLVLFRGGQ